MHDGRAGTEVQFSFSHWEACVRASEVMVSDSAAVLSEPHVVVVIVIVVVITVTTIITIIKALGGL